MELLAWPSLTDEETVKVRAFLDSVILCDLTPRIRVQAVAIRREHRLKLPDAIICATALEHDAELWTNDSSLPRVAGLRCRKVELLRQ